MPNPILNDGLFKVGGTIRLKSSRGSYRVWKITGLFYGCENNEDLVGLKRLDAGAGSAYGKTIEETLMPLCFLTESNTVEIA